MDYFIWWMMLLLTGSCQISGNKEMLDLLVVYRTPFDPSAPWTFKEKIKEYHRWGNAKDMLLKNYDDYIGMYVQYSYNYINEKVWKCVL
ncbi:Protein of unknown function [Gryllus bimaculatus]|nr:Protein of unknown function [Gryllus bimaculatus]